MNPRKALLAAISKPQFGLDEDLRFRAGCGSIDARPMNWIDWTPREYATLCFIIKNDRILLIHKKRGLGAGKVNGPGGKIEPGETDIEAAIRETQEEIGVTPLSLSESGVLHFQFADGYSLHCTVFRADNFVGEPIETDEAEPFWSPVSEIPFHQMWEDDVHWFPLMLRRQYFRAYFEFEGEQMLSKHIEVESEARARVP